MSTISGSINSNGNNVGSMVITSPVSTTMTTTTNRTAATAMTPPTMTFSLSVHRQLIVSRNSIAIHDETTRINLSPQRWAKLCEVSNDIDVAIERLVMKDANVY